MFLHQIKIKNPKLIETAVSFHQQQRIPPNTFLFDLDLIYENAKSLVWEAEKHRLQSYLMTKQYNRNPFVTAVALKQGFNGVVAVDTWGAKVTHRCGNRVSHIGHLNQIPKCEVKNALLMAPEVITVYSVQEAQMVSEAAIGLGKVQDVLLRVYGKDDIFFTAQEGGIPEEELTIAVEGILKLKGVRIMGVTSFPCLNYNLTPDEEIRPTPNFHTILRAADVLRDKFGIEVLQINAPGNNFTANYELLALHGATHVEPGQALLGTTPSHSFAGKLPEKPAFVYVTEVSHKYENQAYVFGGGFWVGAKLAGNMERTLVGSTPALCMDNELVNVYKEGVIIDYHGFIQPGNRCKIGDTVIYGFYSQIQMTRSYTAVASGIHKGKPKLEGIFDHASNLLDQHWCPVSIKDVKSKIGRLLDQYS